MPNSECSNKQAVFTELLNMETLQVEWTETIARVWLNQPDRLNVITAKTLKELPQIFASLDQNDSLRVIILAARGKVFSAGFDISWMANLSARRVAAEIDQAKAVYDCIENCRKPTIAVVNGPAIGGGLLLVLVTDFCLASEEAEFGAPEVKIGIFPGLALIPRLERRIGVAAAKSMVLTGESVSAVEAARIGLIHRVIPAGNLIAEANLLGEKLASLPPGAIQTAKQAFHAARQPNFADWENKRFLACWKLKERQKAMEPFLSRKKAGPSNPDHKER